MNKARLIPALFVIVLGVLACTGSASASSTGDLSGIVFADADSDGLLGDADVPLPNFSLFVFSDNSNAHPTSNDSGIFHVTDLPVGDYTIHLNGGYECIDPLRSSWLGDNIQGFCTHGGVSINVTVTVGEEANVLVPLMGFVGHLGGRIWLDAMPPPAGTPIEARSGDTVCASTITATRQLGSAIIVSEFSLIFGRTCMDGDISLFAGDRQFAQTTGEQVWRDGFDAWNYASRYFSTHEYKSPGFQPFFAAISGNYKPVSVRAVIDGVLCGSISGKGVVLGLIVLPEELRPGCGVDGSPESFCIGGGLADQTLYWTTYESYFAPTLQRTETPCPISVLMGDGNCDGDVTPADITDGLRAEIEGIEAQCAGELNTDCDYEVTIKDLLPVLGYLAGVGATGTAGCPAVGEAQA